MRFKLFTIAPPVAKHGKDKTLLVTVKEINDFLNSQSERWINDCHADHANALAEVQQFSYNGCGSVTWNCIQVQVDLFCVRQGHKSLETINNSVTDEQRVLLVRIRRNTILTTL